MSYISLYNKYYKSLLFIPAVLLLLSLAYIGYFYLENDSIIYRDVSLTGGTSYTIETDYPAQELEAQISSEFRDYTVRGVSNGAGNQIQIVVTVTEEESEFMKTELERILGFDLTEENSSEEFTDSGLSEDFFKQLIIAVILAFFWMAAVVFIIFASGWKIKAWIVIGNLAFAIFLGHFFLTLPPLLSGIIFLAFLAIFVYVYISNSVPAFAVMLSAFADIVMTLAVVDLLGMRLSTAGIVAFLMIIGYSVDTDILLTTRILNRKESTNRILKGAFVTGITMGLTSMIALVAALITVYFCDV
jgi:preprotein translocase subunit SecF